MLGKMLEKCFNVYHDELWVYVNESQDVRCMLTATESCDQVFDVIELFEVAHIQYLTIFIQHPFELT